MAAIEILVEGSGARLWQKILVERLRAAGHEIGVVHVEGKSEWPLAMRAAAAFERRLFRRSGPGLAAAADIAEAPPATPPALRLDLAGTAPLHGVPTLRLAFDGSPSDAAVPAATAAGRLPDIEAILDGEVVARAAPMIDKRTFAMLGADDVLARAITLAVSVAGRIVAAGTGDAPASPLRVGDGDAVGHGNPPFLRSYVFSALPKLGREALRRARFRHAHWRVGYRFADGPGVAETGEPGSGWRQVPDDGSRFYADPFPFEWRGRHFIFLEDYPHATGKALISVVEVDETGTAPTPRPVLEEPFHLSYPQIFERDDAIWMLPEASASNRLTLYRAERFPDRWVPEAILLDGMVISDATLFEYEGRLWLFATDRDDYGSTSDTLVVFHAPALKGPWTPHRGNPVLIDRRRARPGGAFQRIGGRILLPIQDGTKGYGGGLGLSELLELDEDNVRLSDPAPVGQQGDWPYPQIHTLNRAGRLEVIDGIAAVRKR
ncbi:MAG: hypothetical protein L0I29_07585 [Hyphomicrobiales bacterium]|nr:hypothetical protein [Hyphomicrobiales bacterium]